MKSKVFDILVKLMRGNPESPANKSARLVLVEGYSQGDAMRATGASRSTVSITVGRFSEADRAVREAYGIQS